MYMFKYVVKRLGLMLFTFIIIFTMCFVLIKLLPIPTNVLPGQDPEIVMKTLEGRGWITNIREGENGVYDYDRVPIMLQYGNYIKRVLTKGDFGIATTYGEYLNMDLREVFVSHLPPTMLINIYSTLIGVPIGLALGIWAALKKNKWQDQMINVIIILLISVPSIVLALLIQYVFCFKLGWFPLTMSTSKEYFTWPVFRSMLPAVAHAFVITSEVKTILYAENLLVNHQNINVDKSISMHSLNRNLQNKQEISQHFFYRCWLFLYLRSFITDSMTSMYFCGNLNSLYSSSSV